MVMESSELSRCFRLSFPLPPEKLLPRFFSRLPNCNAGSCACRLVVTKRETIKNRYVQFLLRVNAVLLKDEKTGQISAAKVNNRIKNVN
jgi:hypothetical protein